MRCLPTALSVMALAWERGTFPGIVKIPFLSRLPVGLLD